MITPQTQRLITQLAEDMAARFTPPEYIPGCKVLSVADKDQYASDNGWVDALCGRHNRQRCRWMGQVPGVAVDDYIDVVFYPSYSAFVVAGQGGTNAAATGNYLLTAGTRAGATSQAQDFGANGIEADVVAESTGAAGVTVDGVLVKDGDVYPANITSGLKNRLITNGVTLGSIVSHFSTGDTAGNGEFASYSWISDATFSGAATVNNWSLLSDYFYARASGSGLKNFLAKTSAYPGDIRLYARISTGYSADIGLRIDDTTNTKYGEIRCIGNGDGTISLSFVSPSGTATMAINVPAGSFLTVLLYYINSLSGVYGYLVPEYSQPIVLPSALYSFGSNPANVRTGILLADNVSNYGVMDWFRSTI